MVASPDGANGGVPEDLAAAFTRFTQNATLDFAASALASAELDPKRRELWEQLRRAAEIDAVIASRKTLLQPEQALPDEATPTEAAWRLQSRALGELQYWLITTGNPDAESAMIDVIQRAHATERWLAVEADAMLRKGWSVHRLAPTNLRMEAGRALIREGRAPEAARAFVAIAGACDPPWAEAHRWHAKVCHLALGDVAGALAAYDRALNLSPRNYPLLFEYGGLLVRDAAVEASLGGPRAAGSAARAARGAELLGRAAELNPLLLPKVQSLLGDETDD